MSNAAAAAIAQLEQLNPAAARLAKAVSFAVVVDRALLRTARMELVPGADAGAEADLWFSAIVQSRTADGLVLDRAAAEELRKQMTAEEVERVWGLTRRLHKPWLAPSLMLEEEIAYLSVSRAPTAGEQMAQKLRSVVAAMVTGERAGIAEWATRALAMFPSSVRDLTETRMIESGTRMRLGRNPAPPGGGDAPLPEWMPWVAPPSLGRVALGLAWREGELDIHAASPDERFTIEVPATNPVLLEISWEEAGGRRTKQATFRQGESVTVPVGGSELRVRTVTGEQYDLCAEGATPAALQPHIIDFSDILRDRVVIDRVSDLELLRSAANDGAPLVVLHGDAGVGKTAVLCRLIQELRRSDIPVFAHFFVAGDFRRESIAAAERSIIAQIALRFGLPETLIDTRLCDVLQRLALHPARPKRLVIIFDDIDDALTERRERAGDPLGEIFPVVMPPFVTIVCSITAEEVSGRMRDAVVDRLGPADDAVIAAYARLTLKDPALVARIVRDSGGNFAFAEALRAIGAGGNTVDDFVRGLFLPPSLAAIAAARQPLPAAIFASALPTPAAVLLRRDGQSVSILNDVARRAVLEMTPQAEAHRDLVAILMDHLDDPVVADYYFLRAPWHLIEAENFDAAEKLLLDLDFLKEKIERYGVASAAADLRAHAVTQMPRVVLAAIESEARSIEESPEDLAAILYTAMLNAGVPVRQIESVIGSPPPLAPARPVRDPAPRWPRRHAQPVVGSAMLELAVSTLATWSSDGTIMLWTHEQRSPPEVLVHKAAVTAFASRGRIGISGDANGFLYVWDLVEHRRLARTAAHERAVRGLAFVDEERLRFVSWADEPTIRGWEFRDGALTRGLEITEDDPVLLCIPLPKEQALVSFSRTGLADLWNVQAGEGPLEGWVDSDITDITGVVGSRDGTWFISADKTVLRLKQRLTGKVDSIQRQWTSGHEADISGLLLSPDERYLATWSADQTVRVWDVASTFFGNATEPLHVLRGHGGAVTAVQFLPGQRRLVSASADGTAIVWQLDSGEPAFSSPIVRHLRPIRTIAINGDEVFTAGDDGIVKRWDAKTQVHDDSLPPGRIDACVSLGGSGEPAFISDGERSVSFVGGAPVVSLPIRDPQLRAAGGFAVVWSSSSELLMLVDLNGRSQVEIANPPHGVVTAGAVAEGPRFAVALRDGPIRLWEEPRRSTEYHQLSGRHVTALALQPERSRLIAATWDGTLAVFDVARPEMLWIVQAHAAPILALAVHGQRVATAAADGALRVWDLDRGPSSYRAHRGHTAEVTSLYLSASLLISSSSDGTLRVWDSASERAVCRGHRERITGFDVDGDTIYSCSEDRTVRMWNAVNGEQTGIVYGTSPFRCIAAGDDYALAGDDAGNLWSLHVRAARTMPFDCYISYPRDVDRSFLMRLEQALQMNGIRTPIDRGIRPPVLLDTETRRAIRSARTFVAVQTPFSTFGRQELQYAIEQLGPDRIVILTLEKGRSPFVGVPALMGRKPIDFSDWREPARFDAAVQQLVRAIRIGPAFA